MAETRVAQNYANHRKFVPMFHLGASLLLVVNLVWAGVRIYHLRGGGRFDHVDGWVQLLLAVALIVLLWYVRTFPVGVQDRVIRLEMRLRLSEVLPAELRARIGELSVGQLIALRFASDEEMAGLVRQVLDGQLVQPDAIKRQVRSWQADNIRI